MHRAPQCVSEAIGDYETTRVAAAQKQNNLQFNELESESLSVLVRFYLENSKFSLLSLGENLRGKFSLLTHTVAGVFPENRIS